jgi:Icc protein
MLTVVQITDTHIFTDPKAELYGVNTRDTLTRVIEHVKRSGLAYDLVFMTGDLSHDELESSYEIIQSYIQTLDVPVMSLPGNHDAPLFMEKYLSYPTRDGVGHYAIDPWLFISLDSSVREQVSGKVSAATLDKLAALLDANPDKYVLVGVHHHPVKVGSAWMDRIGLENGDQLMDALQAHGKVQVVICGHIHQELSVTVDGIQIYGTPASCFQFTPNTLEAGIDDKPPGYRVLRLHDDGTHDTQVIFLPEAE